MLFRQTQTIWAGNSPGHSYDINIPPIITSSSFPHSTLCKYIAKFLGQDVRPPLSISSERTTSCRGHNKFFIATKFLFNTPYLYLVTCPISKLTCVSTLNSFTYIGRWHNLLRALNDLWFQYGVFTVPNFWINNLISMFLMTGLPNSNFFNFYYYLSHILDICNTQGF